MCGISQPAACLVGQEVIRVLFL